MKGNISKEAAQALQNPETRREVMRIVQGTGSGTIRVGGTEYEIYRASSQPSDERTRRR